MTPERTQFLLESPDNPEHLSFRDFADLCNTALTLGDEVTRLRGLLAGNIKETVTEEAKVVFERQKAEIDRLRSALEGIRCSAVACPDGVLRSTVESAAVEALATHELEEVRSANCGKCDQSETQSSRPWWDGPLGPKG
jgi:hypothetical protein